MTIIESLISDAVKIAHTVYCKEENKSKIDTLAGSAMNTLLDRLKPYFFLLVGLLVTLVLLNFIQFYYYIKIFMRQINETDKSRVLNEIMLTTN